MQCRSSASGKRPVLPTATEIRAITTNSPCPAGLPNRLYTEPEFLEWEKEHVFKRGWVGIGNACEVPNPGDVAPVRFLGIPLLMVRATDGSIRVFHNVCMHRGNELVWEAGRAGTRIRCPYHAWNYDLEGNLCGTPHVGGPGVHEVEGFRKGDHGLRSVPCAVWMDLVFVNISGNADTFADFIAPLQQRVNTLACEEHFASLLPAVSHAAVTLEFAGNWKLCLENNLEAYHLPWVHPALSAISPLEAHYSYEGDNFAGQGSTAYDHRRDFDPVFPQGGGWPAGVSEYPTLYPNVFLGLHCDHLWTLRVEPVTPDRTRDHLRLYYVGDGATAQAYAAMRERRLEAWVQVFTEDLGVVEGMQRGRASDAFSGGVFTPVMDRPSLHFARWMVRHIEEAST